MNKVENGNTVKVHYKGSFNDGTVFDSSYDRGEALSFKVGSGQMIPGFDQAVNGMEVGEIKKISLTPDLAYGESNPEAFTEVPKDSFPEDFPLHEGVTVQGESPSGNPMIGTIDKVDDNIVLLNLNHPMAGKELNFEIELVEIDENAGNENANNEDEEGTL